MNGDDIGKFEGNLARLLDERLTTTNTDGGSDDLDATLSERPTKEPKLKN